jgi:hypothetical protein
MFNDIVNCYLGSVSMALMSFLFIGLNVVRLKLSRDSLEKAVRDARAQIDSLQHNNMIERNIAADLQRKIDLINICRPLARTTSFALTNILATSILERKEMIRTHQQALATQRREGREDGIEESYTFSLTEQLHGGSDIKDNEGSAPSSKAIGRPLLIDGAPSSEEGVPQPQDPTIANDLEVMTLPGIPSHEPTIVPPPQSSTPRLSSHDVVEAKSSAVATRPMSSSTVSVNVNSLNSAPIGASSRALDGLGHKYSITVTDRTQALPSPSLTAKLSNHQSGTAATSEPGHATVTVAAAAAAVGDEATLIKGAFAGGYANIRDSEITLDIILGHPVTVEFVKDRLSQLHAPETLLFYLEVQHYKRAPPANLKKMAMDIHESYIKADAENQVNFSATLRTLLSKRVKEPSPSAVIFKEAERESHRLLMQNAWPSFRASPEFQVCAMILRGLAAPPERSRTTL